MTETLRQRIMKCLAIFIEDLARRKEMSPELLEAVTLLVELKKMGE